MDLGIARTGAKRRSTRSRGRSVSIDRSETKTESPVSAINWANTAWFLYLPDLEAVRGLFVVKLAIYIFIFLYVHELAVIRGYIIFCFRKWPKTQNMRAFLLLDWAYNFLRIAYVQFHIFSGKNWIHFPCYNRTRWKDCFGLEVEVEKNRKKRYIVVRNYPMQRKKFTLYSRRKLFRI